MLRSVGYPSSQMTNSAAGSACEKGWVAFCSPVLDDCRACCRFKAAAEALSSQRCALATDAEDAVTGSDQIGNLSRVQKYRHSAKPSTTAQTMSVKPIC